MKTFCFDGGTAQIGQNLICVKSRSPYFIEGKTYQVVKHHRYDHPVVVDETGCEIKWSKSEFSFAYQQQQRPIKLHQVWERKEHSQGLVRIRRIERDMVYYEYLNWFTSNVHLRGVRKLDTFYKNFIFIF